MASSTVYHARSISLPSRPHPTAEQLAEQLCRLRSSQSASFSTTFVSDSLNGLRDLYSCVDELLQQSLSQNQNTKWVDEVLDGSLRLLDICSASRDALQQSKERLQDVQSALRRRCSGELSITKEAVEYIVGSQKSGWSVVTKIMNKNTNKETSTTEFDELDSTLNSLVPQRKSGMTASQMENLMSQSLKLESQIQDINESLESLFRDLVKTRATLLNIFSY